MATEFDVDDEDDAEFGGFEVFVNLCKYLQISIVWLVQTMVVMCFHFIINLCACSLNWKKIVVDDRTGFEAGSDYVPAFVWNCTDC